MAEHIILIPDKVKYAEALICVFDPTSSEATVEFTLKGEDEPFRTGKLQRRSNEIAAFVFRPKILDVKKKEFTKPLKKGDILDVKVTVEKTTKSQKVEIV